MPISIMLTSPESTDQYQLASGTGWTKFGAWAVRLPRGFELLRELYEDGNVQDTLALGNQLKRAWDEHRPQDKDTAGVVQALIDSVGVGSSDEAAQVVD